jgi:hypothetical protein
VLGIGRKKDGSERKEEIRKEDKKQVNCMMKTEMKQMLGCRIAEDLSENG